MRRLILSVVAVVLALGALSAGRALTIGSGEEESSNPAVKAARQDMAQRLGIAPDDIEVVRATSVEWPDTSLGAPEPDQMYAQVVTPGYEIVLRTSEDIGENLTTSKGYKYHTDEAGERVKLVDQVVSAEKGRHIEEGAK